MFTVQQQRYYVQIAPAVEEISPESQKLENALKCAIPVLFIYPHLYILQQVLCDEEHVGPPDTNVDPMQQLNVGWADAGSQNQRIPSLFGLEGTSNLI